MSSRTAQKPAQQNNAGGGGNDDAFLVTKEEKEAMLNRKMEEIRRKNEALKKRHQMIEADRLAAEKSGQAVNVKLSATTEPSAPNKPHMKGVYPEGEGQDRKSKFAAGRGRRLANRSKDELKVQPAKPDNTYTAPGSGDSGKKAQSSGSTRSQEQKSPSVDGPPPDPSYSFLSDRSREGPLRDARGPRSPKYDQQYEHQRGGGGGGRGRGDQRHPRNFGGRDFNSVKKKIQYEKQSQGRGRGARSEIDMQLQMTGKERREYSEWKREREKIDQVRIERQKTAEGDWRREWDKEKDEQTFDSTPAPPVPRHMEPGRRPAGRIGSGRFDRGDDERAMGPGYEPEREPPSRGRGAPPERGRGRGGRGGRGAGGGSGRPPSERSLSTGSDDRSVEEQNDSLLIKVDNEFAAQKDGGRGGGGPRDRGRGQRGQGRGGRWVRGQGQVRGAPMAGRVATASTKDQNSDEQDSKTEHKVEAGPDEHRGAGQMSRSKQGASKPRRTVGSGRIGSGRLASAASNSQDEEKVSVDEEDAGDESRPHLNSSGSAGEWETDTSSQDLANAEEEDEYWEDDEEFYRFHTKDDPVIDEDVHNSSIESFDDSAFNKFIEKNTLRIDAKTGLPTEDATGHYVVAGPVTPTSPDTNSIPSLKTPTDHNKVLDWGAEMDALSPAASKSGSGNTTSSSQSPNDSPRKGDDGAAQTQNLSISSHDDSMNTSSEVKRQALFPESTENSPQKNDDNETATEEPEEPQKEQIKELKSETEFKQAKTSDIEEQVEVKTSQAEAEELPVKSVDTERKDNIEEEKEKQTNEEEEEKFEDTAEDETDEFVDAESNVATPVIGSREVSAEPSPHASPQHAAITAPSEETSQNIPDDATPSEDNAAQSKDDAEKSEDDVASKNDVTQSKDNDDVFDKNVVETEIEAGDVLTKPDVEPEVKATEAGSDESDGVVQQVADEQHGTTKDNVTSSEEQEKVSEEKASEVAEDEKTSPVCPSNDSGGNSDGASVNTEKISPEVTSDEIKETSSEVNANSDDTSDVKQGTQDDSVQPADEEDGSSQTETPSNNTQEETKPETEKIDVPTKPDEETKEST